MQWETLSGHTISINYLRRLISLVQNRIPDVFYTISLAAKSLWIDIMNAYSKRLQLLVVAVAVVTHLEIVTGQTNVCTAPPQIPDAARKLQQFVAGRWPMQCNLTFATRAWGGEGTIERLTIHFSTKGLIKLMELAKRCVWRVCVKVSTAESTKRGQYTRTDYIYAGSSRID